MCVCIRSRWKYRGGLASTICLLAEEALHAPEIRAAGRVRVRSADDAGGRQACARGPREYFAGLERLEAEGGI